MKNKLTLLHHIQYASGITFFVVVLKIFSVITYSYIGILIKTMKLLSAPENEDIK